MEGGRPLVFYERNDIITGAIKFAARNIPLSLTSRAGASYVFEFMDGSVENCDK
jgi:hypothetical protein